MAFMSQKMRPCKGRLQNYEKRLSPSSQLSVRRLSALNNSAPTGSIFIEIDF
jgi:hypothetical protein